LVVSCTCTAVALEYISTRLLQLVL